jgi:hypothetical protein
VTLVIVPVNPVKKEAVFTVENSTESPTAKGFVGVTIVTTLVPSYATLVSAAVVYTSLMKVMAEQPWPVVCGVFQASKIVLSVHIWFNAAGGPLPVTLIGLLKVWELFTP